VWDAASGVELACLDHDETVIGAFLTADGAQVVTASTDEMVRVWDVTWAARLTGERLVRAVARERLKGMGRLTEEELRILRPILGEVDPDVTSRWLAPSPDPAEDAEIDAILAQWRRHREMALALAKRDWTARAERIRADLVARRAAAAGPPTSAQLAPASRPVPVGPPPKPAGPAQVQLPVNGDQPESAARSNTPRRNAWLLLISLAFR
jgi:hypothetical protein